MVSAHIYVSSDASLIKPSTQPLKANVPAIRVYPDTWEENGTEASPSPPFFFLLHLKIAVILLSRRTRFDVRFLDLAAFPFIAARWRDGALPPRRQECPTTAAVKTRYCQCLSKMLTFNTTI